MGRLFIRELSEAILRVKSGDEESKLDVIANAIGYANHLARHIAKEDTVVYTFAEKKLSKELLELVDKKTEEFEEEAKQQGIQNYYIKILNELEAKYLP